MRCAPHTDASKEAAHQELPSPEMGLRGQLLLQVLDQRMDGHACCPAARPKSNLLLLATAVHYCQLPLLNGAHSAVQHQLYSAPATPARPALHPKIWRYFASRV